MLTESLGTLANRWTYDSHNLLASQQWGNLASPSISTIISANSRGLTALFAGAVTAVSTDALGNPTVDAMDVQGRLLQEIAPNGGISTWTRNPAGQVTAFVDPMGRATTYTLDSAGYVTLETAPDATTQQFAYGAFHNLTSFTDENGNVTTDTFDALGHMLTSTDPMGDVTAWTYSTSTGLVATMVDPMSRTTSYAYDSYRRLTATTTPLGTATETYDPVTGEVATVTDPMSLVTAMGYDADGDMTSLKTPDGISELWSFNSAGLLSSDTGKTGLVDTPSYDNTGRVLVVSDNDGGRVTRDTLDAAGQVVASTDALGNITADTLDVMGNVVLVTDALGNKSRSVYNLDGEVTDSFDADGAHTKDIYNNRGWVTATFDALGNSSGTTYDKVGNATAETDPLGHVTSTAYDKDNRVTSETDALGHIVDSTTYWPDGTVKTETDALGAITSTTNDFVNKQIVTTAASGTGLAETTTDFMNADWAVASEKDALNHTTIFTLNALNEMTAASDPLNRVTSETFDPNGNATSATDGNNHTTNFTLDAFGDTVKATDPTGDITTAVIDANGNPIANAGGPSGGGQSVLNAVGNDVEEIDADGNAVRNQYDAAGQLIISTDALGNRTQWQYDKAGNQVGEILPNGATRSWQYDAAGNLIGSTDELGRSETYAYDADNRLLTETWKDATGAVVNTLHFTYNNAGEVLTEGDNSGTISMGYDLLGRQTSQTDVWGLTLTLGYDAANDLTSETDSLGGTTTNVFDANNELTNMKFSDTSGHALSLNYAYDAAGEVTLAKRYSDATETTLIGQSAYGYDNAGRVASIADKNAAGTALDSFNYGYNSAGQVTSATSLLGPSAAYAYDAAGQLLSDGTKSNNYDAEGNRTNSGDITATGNELATDGTWNYSYDAAGNEIEKVNISTGEVWLYSYDNANRMVEAQHKPSGTGVVDLQVNYAYDVLGNRIEESVSVNGGAATVTKFAYDQNGNAWADLNASGALVTRRIYGNAVDALVARIDSTGVAWYLTDNLGSVRDITNSSGALIDHRDYDSFGTIANETNPSFGDRYGFTSREFDVYTDLQYNRARYYDPSTGRWMSQDPLGFGAGDSNLYRYTFNAPTSFTDPSGKIVFFTAALIAGAVLLAGGIGHLQAPAPGDPTFPGDQNVIADSIRFTLMARGANGIRAGTPGALPSGAAGLGFDLLHQGAGNLDDVLHDRDLRGISGTQLAQAGFMGSALGPLDRLNPRAIRYPLLAMGTASGVSNLANGELATGAVDLAGTGYLAGRSRRLLGEDLFRLRIRTLVAPASQGSAPQTGMPNGGNSPPANRWQWTPSRPQPAAPRPGQTAPSGDIPELIQHVGQIRGQGASVAEAQQVWADGMRLINQRAAQFPGNGQVVNNFLGTAYGGWRVYMGQPAQPGGPAFMVAFNEQTGMVVSGTGRGLMPHPTIPGQNMLRLQNQTVIFP